MKRGHQKKHVFARNRFCGRKEFFFNFARKKLVKIPRDQKSMNTTENINLVDAILLTSHKQYITDNNTVQ